MDRSTHTAAALGSAGNALGWEPSRLAGRPALVDQLVSHCANLIERHGLRAGTRLPSVRSLADSVGVSRDTVVQAYDRLVAQGLLHSRRGAGFYVSGQGLQSPAEASQPLGLAPDARFDTAFLLRSMFRQQGRETFDGGAGLLPASWMDDEMLNAAIRGVGRSLGQHLLGYGQPQGFQPLRQQIAAQLQTQGVPAHPDQQMMTVAGVTQGMDLIVRTLLRPGDAVLVEDPAWFLVFGCLRQFGLRVLPVPRRPDGPDLQVLEQLCAEHRPRMFITNTAVHNPTGYGLSLGVAHDLLRLAERYGLWLLEDDTYADFLPGTPVRLAALDRLQRVLLVGGFSKTLAGSLRVGYIAAQADLIRQLTDAKLLSGLTSAELGERVVYKVLADGQYRKHLQRLRERVDRARGQCLRQLTELGLQPLHEPQAGMFVWVDCAVDTEVLARRAAAQQLLLAPGVLFSPQQQASSMLRLPVSIADAPGQLARLEALIQSLGTSR